MFAALHERVRTALHERVRPVVDQRVRPALLGSDPEAVRVHLRVVAGLAAGVTAVTALTRVATVVVSPVVWDAFFAGVAATLLAFTVANAYWRGGLLVGYAFVAAPTAAGLFVAYVGRGAFDAPARTLGFGLLLVAAVAVVVGTPGFVVGYVFRWLRTRWLDRREGSA